MHSDRRAVVIRVVLVLLLCSTVALEAFGQAKSFRQDRFVVGFWGDPPVDNIIKARYADVAAANFNIVLGGMGADSPPKAKKQRDTCERLGLKVIFSTYGLPVEDLCDCDTTFGFLIRDHPLPAEFKAVRERVDEVRRKRAGKLPLINLFPESASAAEMGASSYQDYLAKFIEAVDPEVLCYDHFASFRPDADGRGAWCGNLATVRNQGLAKGIPFWVFVKALPYETTTPPTEAQLRWQIYSAIAHGAKGILYYAYWTPSDDEAVKGPGLITADGKQTERYAQAKRINAELLALGPRLLPLRSTGLHRVRPGADADLPALVKSIAAAAPCELIMGAFDAPKDKKALMAVNYDDLEDTLATVEFAVPLDNVREVDKRTGKEIPLLDDDADAPGLQLRFAAGDGRLLIANP